MENFKKKIPKEFSTMERHLGRMLRNMSLPGMMHYQPGNWSPPVDVYESETEIVVIMDAAGVAPDSLNVVAEIKKVAVAGSRKLPLDNLSRIHQLEIDYGRFERTVSLPVPVDVAKTTSSCKDGLLMIRLPKKIVKGTIKVQSG